MCFGLSGSHTHSVSGHFLINSWDVFEQTETLWVQETTWHWATGSGCISPSGAARMDCVLPPGPSSPPPQAPRTGNTDQLFSRPCLCWPGLIAALGCRLCTHSHTRAIVRSWEPQRSTATPLRAPWVGSSQLVSKWSSEAFQPATRFFSALPATVRTSLPVGLGEALQNSHSLIFLPFPSLSLLR